ncbi:MAG TPA: hypothetical protein VF057_13635, partial [Thermoanaerobaculia bacterium]
GTHRSTFFDSEICGADTGNGPLKDDPFFGAPVNFLGMLVDLEPYGSLSSQLFFDKMSFGIDGGDQIIGKPTTRFTDRYVNFGRTTGGFRAGVGSVIWQTTFAKADLKINAFDSSALKALAAAIEDDDVLGLTVQWNAYHTVYFNDPATTNKSVPAAPLLFAKLEGGGFQPNPARSLHVGVIGLWRKGESVSEPCDRALMQQQSAVATAHARVTKSAIVLDLSNSIPENTFSLNPAELTKQDLGELTLAAGTAQVTFDYSKYDMNAYLQTAGIVTLPITADPSADLQLLDSKQNVLLAEQDLRAIPTIPNLYVDEGADAEVKFQLYDRGVPASTAGIEVTVYALTADANTILTTITLQTASDGTATLPISTSTPGITAYAAWAGPNPVAPTQGLDPQAYTFEYVRILPADANIAALPPTFANVFAYVLSDWKAMAPCMDNWLDLANETQIRAFAPMIRKLTDPAYFEAYRYMPVTRDMTAGERALLYNFLGPAPPSHLLKAAAAAPAEKPMAKFAQLSKVSRSGSGE